LELVPFVAAPDAHPLSKAFDLGGWQEPAVIVLVAGKGQAMALDRVADKAGGLLVMGLGECLDEVRQVVDSEIGHQLFQLLIRAGIDQPRYRSLVADVVEQLPTPGSAPLEDQLRIPLIVTVVDPGAQPFAAQLFERLLESRAVFQDLDMPA